MKPTFFALALAAFVGLFGTNSYALVIEDANCKNSNVEVTIIDNQGIGIVRKSRPVALVMDSSGKTIFMANVKVQGLGFVDSTNPGDFSLVQRLTLPFTPPGTKPPFGLSFQLPGSSKPNVEVVTCTVFNEF